MLAETALIAVAADEATAGIDAALEAIGALRSDGRTGPNVEAPFEWSRSEREAQSVAVTLAFDELARAIDDRGWQVFEGCN